MSSYRPGEFDLSGYQPAPSAEPRAWSTWPSPARWASGCGLGCLGLVLLQVLGLYLFTQLMPQYTVPEGVKARVVAPARVVEGQKFPLRIVVRNGSEESVRLSTVLARDKLTEQLTLENPRPAPSAPSVSAFGTRAWEFKREVAPGKSLEVLFDATATRAGKVEQDLEVQFGIAPQRVPVRLDVTPKSKQPATPPAR